MAKERITHRFRSVRGYRRLLDHVLKEAYEGKRPASDLGHFQQAAKVAADLMMAERLLARYGGDSEVSAEDHAHGDDGGLELPRRGEYRRKRVVVKGGVNARGLAVDEKTVTVEGGEDDEGLENEADAEFV